MKNIYDNERFFEAYADMPRSRDGLKSAGEWGQLEPLFPILAQKNVLDLGCGYGWHSKYARERGAAFVLGIDQSEKMIAEALKRNSAKGIAYRVCSLQEYDYPAETYDLVISNLVLHYIEDLDMVYRNVFQTLKQGGVFLFNIEHPVFTAGVNQQWLTDGKKNLCWPVDDYFYPGERTTDFLGHTVKKQHHTLTQILMGLIDRGFHLEAVEEVMPPEAWRAQMPDEMRRPMMLIVKARK
ncbi:MAG: class I SAM-dependent methyltransferase [Lachnospiraceae bacterium]|nr:class I SAM-dependent methyltransferase [Lachnospiraceae bacterium]